MTRTSVLIIDIISPRVNSSFLSFYSQNHEYYVEMSPFVIKEIIKLALNAGYYTQKQLYEMNSSFSQNQPLRHKRTNKANG